MNFSLTYPSQIDVIILSMEKILRTVETYRLLPSSQTDHWVMHMQDRSQYHVKSLNTELTLRPESTEDVLEVAP